VAVNSQFIAAREATVTIGGTPMPFNDCTVRRTIGTWDATNLLSGGDYEEGTDIKQTTVQGSYVQDTTAGVINLTLGALVSVTFAVTGEQTYSGSLRVNSIEKKAGARGGMMVTIAGNFTGTTTVS
jgi:hypothetical protein